MGGVIHRQDRTNNDEPIQKTFFDFKKGSKIRSMEDLPEYEIKKGQEFSILSDISVIHRRRVGWINRAQICVNGVIEMVDLSNFRLLCPEGIQNGSQNC